MRRKKADRPGKGTGGRTAGPGKEPEAGVAQDPVCGMSVTIGTARLTSEHGGRTFYFGNASCQFGLAFEPLKGTLSRRRWRANPDSRRRTGVLIGVNW